MGHAICYCCTDPLLISVAKCLVWLCHSDCLGKMNSRATATICDPKIYSVVTTNYIETPNDVEFKPTEAPSNAA